MIFSNKNISVRQMQSLFITEVFGTAVVYMPSLVWSIMEGKGIVAIALGFVPFFIYLYLIKVIYKDKTTEFSEVVKGAMGKGMAKAIFIMFWLKIVFVSGLWLSEFSQIIVKTLLPIMPYRLIALIIVLICIYFGGKGIEVRGRSSEIFIEFMAIFFIPMIIIVALGADYTNILPIYGFKARETGLAILYGFTALGSADYLLFLYPKVDSDKRFKGIKTGGVVVLVLVLVCVATVYGVFGEAIVDKDWAMLNMMDTVDFPGAFIERQDVLMIGFWIISFFIYISGGITYGGYLLGEVTGREVFLVNGIIIYIVSILNIGVSITSVLLVTTPIFLIVVPFVIMVARGS